MCPSRHVFAQFVCQSMADIVLAGAESVSLMQQMWLMKAVVIELRVTSLNRQRSHTERLMALLLDDSFHLQSAAGNLPTTSLCYFNHVKHLGLYF